MAASQDCKKIEKCLKDILKTMSGEEALGNKDVTPSFNHNPFSIDDKCLVTNIEKMALVSGSTFSERISTNNLDSQSGASKLIDINNLKRIADKHITDIPFSTTNMALNSNHVKLPHPDLEDDCNMEIRNGEQPGFADLFNTISKEIQNSPNFLSMPDNPLPQILRSPQKQAFLTHSLDKTKPLTDSKQKDDGNDMKNAQKKKKRSNQKRQSKDRKVKDRMAGLYIAKELSEVEKKNLQSKEEHNLKSPSKSAVNNIKSIEKRPVESGQLPDIKMKKNGFGNLVKEYSLSYQEGHFRLQCFICSHSTDMRDSIAKHLNSKPHQSLKTQNDLDMMLPFLPGPVPHQTEAITELLNRIASEQGLRKEYLDARLALSSKLETFVESRLPACSVSLIGSSATGFGLKSCEVDFVLKVASEENIPDSLENLYNLMNSDGAYEKVINDFKKKRPCIKFVDRETSLPCNILIDNGSSSKLASLLSIYAQLDDRVLTLGVALRYWAKLCQIDQQDYGTLPSFCFALLLVHFLQQVEPPILPVLHEVEGYGSSTEFYEKFVLEKQWKSENRDSVGDLWLKFFHFYNFDYKIGENVVCIRSSKRVTCKERNWSTRFYAIEDPFLKRNLAYVIPTFQVCHYIQQCFVRTYRYFAYPQLKNGSVKLLKTESFDALKLSEYAVNTPLIKEEELGESEDSEIEDADQVTGQDLEDHDADIPIDSFISTMKKMSLNEAKEEIHVDEAIVQSEIQASDSTSTSKDIGSSPKKVIDKFIKDNQTKLSAKCNCQPLCYWDLKEKEITKETFNYVFKAVTFKGEKSVPLTCKLCKTNGHQKKNCPSDDLPKPCLLPKMNAEFLEIIGNVLNKIKDENAVSKSELDAVIADMHDVEKYIREAFPDATLRLFGSFCNGFGFKNKSDMDFCLTFGDRNDGKDLDSTDVIEKVAVELRKHPELENVVSITSAKVPIVKFSWRKTQLEGDISLYNTLALVNTELLEAYTKIDPRVQILGYALKHFAKILGICDASRGSLSSYAYILMVLYFLQQRNPPVIPVLQELYDNEKPSVMIEGCNVYFYRQLDKLKDIWPDYGKNTESAAELWLGLLNFYTCDFDWKEYVVSIKQKKLLTRFRKLWNTDQLAIEDPFDLNHNLGAGLSRKMNSYILKTFIKARERFGTPFTIDPGREMTYLFHRSYLNSGIEPPQDRGCSNCGKIGHIARNCPQEKTCSYCRRPGHLIKNCPKKGRSKKSRDREQNRSYDNSNPDRKGNNERRTSRISNQKMKNDYICRTYPGMQPQSAIGEKMEEQKLVHMGVPGHRFPPPGFQARSIITSHPPPGFKSNSSMPPVNYPPPFNKHPHATPPFPRGGKPIDNHTHSPPKQYSSSPPKAAFHSVQEPPWSMGRQGFQVERHPSSQHPRSLQAERHPVLPGPVGYQLERHYAPRNYPPNWQNRGFRQKDHMPHPNSNQPHNLDHRLPRTNSDNVSYNNSNHLDRW